MLIAKENDLSLVVAIKEAKDFQATLQNMSLFNNSKIEQFTKADLRHVSIAALLTLLELDSVPPMAKYMRFAKSKTTSNLVCCQKRHSCYTRSQSRDHGKKHLVNVVDRRHGGDVIDINQ